MAKNIYLDDLRMPHQSGYKDTEWAIVRSFDEFRDRIIQFGIPEVISFDHDLGEDENGNELPSGYDALKWLTDFDLKFTKIPGNFQIKVHSANPVGRANIEGYAKNYFKFISDPNNL